jgi:hypothetical protein
MRRKNKMNVAIEHYAGDNTNAHRVSIGGASVWFSYRTPIAFAYNGERVVRENDWNVTTGKHLNAIDGGDKKSRVSGEEFCKRLATLQVKIVPEVEE